ncbi:MAG: glycosyltransferase, partial [Acetobacteraceae bacterium]
MTALAAIALLVWVYLLLGHGRFWQGGPVLEAVPPEATPSVAIIVPARDEAGTIEAALRTLLAQDYPGAFRVVLVDDESTDGTGARARGLRDARLTVVVGQPRPTGWSGKLWALAQGIEAAGDVEMILLTDADIVHDPRHLSSLVASAGRCDMVSEMVELSCASPSEAALVPAFVFFFQLLYPFAWVNDPLRARAAAAGGTILLRSRALARIGGIAAVRGALIDDVALAVAIKRGGRIWLGHSALARSVRPYP